MHIKAGILCPGVTDDWDGRSIRFTERGTQITSQGEPVCLRGTWNFILREAEPHRRILCKEET